MKIEIISDFIGRINNIVIKDKRIFYSVEYILSKIENKFGECYNKKFIEDLVEQLNYLDLKIENFEFSKFELEINLDVKSFKEIKFKYYINEFYGIKEFNDNISRKMYSLYKIRVTFIVTLIFYEFL